MLTGSVSEGSFSRNCTMQYASWKNKKQKTKLEILYTKSSKNILLKLPKKFPDSGFSNFIFNSF